MLRLCKARPQTSAKKLSPLPHKTHFIGLLWGPQTGITWNPLRWAFMGTPDGGIRYRGVAQLVARLVRDQEVGCSSHLTPTSVRTALKIHSPCKQGLFIGQSRSSFFPRNPLCWAFAGALGAKSCDPGVVKGRRAIFIKRMIARALMPDTPPAGSRENAPPSGASGRP